MFLKKHKMKISQFKKLKNHKKRVNQKLKHRKVQKKLNPKKNLKQNQKYQFQIFKKKLFQQLRLLKKNYLKLQVQKTLKNLKSQKNLKINQMTILKLQLLNKMMKSQNSLYKN